MARAKNYIRNAEFSALLGAHAEACRKAKKNDQPLPAMPDQLGEQAMMIATRLSLKSNFCGYVYRDDMIQEGLYLWVKYAHNFDLKKSTNGFSWTTEVMKNAFLRVIQKEKECMYRKMMLAEQGAETEGLRKFQRQQNQLNVPYTDWITEYHEKRTAARLRIRSPRVKKEKKRKEAGA